MLPIQIPVVAAFGTWVDNSLNVKGIMR